VVDDLANSGLYFRARHAAVMHKLWGLSLGVQDEMRSYHSWDISGILKILYILVIFKLSASTFPLKQASWPPATWLFSIRVR